MQDVLIFDRTYSREKQAEGLGIYKAIGTGECNKCPYLNQCQYDRNFKFPKDAACTQFKNEFITEWRKSNG